MLINLPSTAELRIKDPYTQFCRMAYPTEQQPCCFEIKTRVSITTRHLDFSLFTFRFSLMSKHVEIFLQRYAAVLVSVVLVEVYQLIHHVHGLACAWFQFLSAQQIAYEHG